MRTLYRYPGSKNKLLPQILPFIEKRINGKKYFVDAFVGGGSVLLEIAVRYPDIHLICNDKDTFVYSFWKLMSVDNVAGINDLKTLVKQQPTIELFYKLRETSPATLAEAAYRAIFFNRTTFSGDMRRTASPIGGKHQNSKYSVSCRYNSQKIIEKIDSINKLIKNRTLVFNDDILHSSILKMEDTVLYLDPPYWEKGKMLYEEFMTENDHKSLAEQLKTKSNWILSYDNCPAILEMYNWANIHFIDARYCIKGSKTNWEKTKEILVIP